MCLRKKNNLVHIITTYIIKSDQNLRKYTNDDKS